MTSKTVIFASPMLCLGVLAVIAADSARHVKPQNAAAYHACAKAAIDEFPYVIGYWTGSDQEVPKAAVNLLRPNALVSRHYVNHPPGGRGYIWADLLISQCADSRDMTGHYPPICYPSSGEPQINARPFSVKAGDLLIGGMEYQFTAVPGRGLSGKACIIFSWFRARESCRILGSCRRVAGDHQRRCFGAAQFQVVMDADQSPEVRDQVFAALIGSDTAVIKALEDAK